MDFNIYMWFISIIPIVVLLFLMSYIKMDSKKAALLSLGTAALLGSFVFKLAPDQLLIAVEKGAALSLYVILIILGAVILYNVVEISGGFATIKKSMENLGGNKSLQFIALAWAFSAFIQGISGFGVPVAIVGSLLIGIGYNPIMALTSVLVGHSWAISFGSMGSSFYALKLVTGLDPIRLGLTMALLFFIPIISTGAAVAHIYGGLNAIKKNLKYIIPAALIMGSMQVLAAAGGFPHIGSLLAGIGGTGFLLIILIKLNKKENKENKDQNRKKGGLSIAAALFPYVLLVISVLIFQIPQISGLLPEIKWQFSFPGFTTGLGYEVSAEESFSSIALFSHPIFFLLVSSITGIIIYIKKGFLDTSKIRQIISGSLKKASSSSLTVLLLMMMALIMNDAGMIYIFARGMAQISGPLFPIFSPLVGILGAFLTGSNTSSNVLFGPFQVSTANLLGLSPYLIASTQSIGGSLGSAIAPAKILLGTSIVGSSGKEGEIIKRCLGYTLISGILIGLTAFILGIY